MKSIKSIIIALVIIVFMVLTYIIVGGFFEPKVYNLMVKNYSAVHKGSNGIILVVIDDKSIERERWPWRRSLYAKIFDYLGHHAKTTLIGFDANLMTEGNKADDAILYDTIKDIDNLVVGFVPSQKPYEDKVSGKAYDEKFKSKFYVPIEDKSSKKNYSQRFNSLSKYPNEYFDSVKKNGSVWVLTHPVDGYIKDIPQIIYYKEDMYLSLGLRMYAALNHVKDITVTNNQIILKGDDDVKINTHKRFGGVFNYLHFYKRSNDSEYTHITYSAIDIIDSLEDIKKGKKPKINPMEFHNKIVFVGANAKAAALGLEDALPTPIYSKHPGVDIQATNLDNLVHNEFISSISGFQELLIYTVLILGTFLVVSYYSLFVSLGLITLSVIAYLVLSIFSYKLGIAVPVITPISLQLVSMIFGYSNKFIIESRNKEKIKVAMGKYISQDIMKNVVKNIDEVKLGGKKSNVTVLFADIRGFTSMSEKLEPDEISVILNDYFTEIEPIISKYNGVINKFVGDAVLAIFGEPIQDKEHALNAVKCANEMLLKVKDLREKWLAEGKPKIEIGVGINTGDAFVGNIGSEKRLEYTVIGDTVNLASRLESYNKIYKTQFLISASTYSHVKGIADVIKISEVKIRGKAKKMNIYEVLRLV